MFSRISLSFRFTCPDFCLVFRTTFRFLLICPDFEPIFRIAELQVIELIRVGCPSVHCSSLWKEFGKHVVLELQDAPELLSCGVVHEAQMSGALYFLLWCEM